MNNNEYHVDLTHISMNSNEHEHHVELTHRSTHTYTSQQAPPCCLGRARACPLVAARWHALHELSCRKGESRDDAVLVCTHIML